MTERITPADIRRHAQSVREDNIAAAEFMERLAAQMERELPKPIVSGVLKYNDEGLEALQLDIPRTALTLNNAIRMFHQTATEKGWHEPSGRAVRELPNGQGIAPALTQLSYLMRFIRMLRPIAEHIRKPDTNYDMFRSLDYLRLEAGDAQGLGLPGQAIAYAADTFHEGFETPLDGSRTEISGWLMLLVTEIAEAHEALEHGDWPHFFRELGDVFIRLCDDLGELMQRPEFQDLDFEGIVRDINEANKRRPYRHGGKQA